jgi:NAD(P)-dependent dehydrogenase (short-subunit alcohol dehydrogenase family)
MSEVQSAGPVASQFIMVAGASSGIGRATAARLADAGHVVFGAALGASALGALAADHPRVRPLVLDVTDQASIGNAHQQVETAPSGHGLDVLVNVAGTLALGPVEAVPDEQTRAQFEVNLFGSLAVTRAFLRPMRERGTGRIVNVSSILGRFVLPGSGLYSASKFAIEAYSDALRMELAPSGFASCWSSRASSTHPCTRWPLPRCPATKKPSSPTARCGQRDSASQAAPQSGCLSGRHRGHIG